MESERDWERVGEDGEQEQNMGNGESWERGEYKICEGKDQEENYN